MAIKPAPIVLLLVLQVLYAELAAQTQNPRYNFKHLDVQNGLAQNIVYHFLQDSRGFVWIGTRNGLTQYDGTRPVNFFYDEKNKRSIASNFITRLLEDADKQLWIGTDVGISRYNRNDNSFSNFRITGPGENKEAAYCVPIGWTNDHEMWLIETKTKSIRVFNTLTQQTETIISTPAVDGTLWYNAQDRSCHIWTYLSSGSIHYTFKNKKLVKEESFFDGTDKQPVFQVVHVLPQKDSVVWVATTAGLISLDPRTAEYRIEKNKATPLVNETRYLALAPNGLLWVATGNNGVYTFNTTTKQYIDHFSNYSLDALSICSNNIVSMYFDKTGNIWCGSYGEGLSYTNVEKNYFQKSFSRNRSEKWQGNNNIRWMGYDKAGDLWCILNNANGLWKLNSNTQEFEYRETILEDGSAFTGRISKLLFTDNSHAWAIGQHGLYQYDLDHNRLRKVSYTFLSADLFGSNWVQDIIRLSDQSYLFTTFCGLYRIVLKNGHPAIEPFSELNKKQFLSFDALYQDNKGTIYIKDGGDILYILEPAANGEYQLTRSISFHPQINQFYPDPATSSLLLATNSGLYQLSSGDHQVTKPILVATIPFLGISSMIKTESRYWLFGEKGLFCYDERTKKARTFTTEDGLPANEFNIAAVLFTSNRCIAGTSNGLVSFFPDTLQDKTYPPRVQLTNFYVNDILIPFVEAPQEKDMIRLTYRQHTFSFEFAPVCFQHAADCSFEYKLQGYDPDWISSGNARYTRYSRIPPGNYIFTIRVIDVNGVISPFSKSVEIEIAKAYWQTNLFRIAVAALLLFLSWILVRGYLRRKIRMHKLEFEKQQAVEKERTRIATDMHDDLGAGLSKIRFLSETVQRNIREDIHQPHLQNIADSSVELVDKFNEIIWAMNEKNNSLEDLLYYMRNYTAKYCEENQLAYSISVPEQVPSLIINGEMRRHIFLTIKEGLHNIVKHAGATSVELAVQLDDCIRISIHDNGKGFDAAALSHTGNGLRNMEQRIKNLNGQLLIKNDKGSLLTIIVPFPVS